MNNISDVSLRKLTQKEIDEIKIDAYSDQDFSGYLPPKRRKMKVKLTIEIDLSPNLINPSCDEERMWVENEILIGNRELIVHSNEIGDFVGEVTSVKNLKWIEED